MKRLSVDELKNADYVSQEKVVFEKLEKGKIMLFRVSSLFDKCLRVGTLLNYYRESDLLEFFALGRESRPFRRLHEVYYIKRSTGKNVNGIKAFQATGKGEYRFWQP